MQLEDKILIILNKYGSLKAKDIATKVNQDYSENLEAKDINSALYGKLKKRVTQDKKYCWSVVSSSIQAISEKKITNSPLSILASYYLDCLTKDREDGISCYASSLYDNLDYAQIKALPNIESSDSIYDDSCKKIINKVKLNRNSYILYLGYPICLRKSFRSNVSFVEPILVIPFDNQSIIYNDNPQLTEDIPRLNFEAIKNLSGLEKSELLGEFLELTEDLGLNNQPSEQPEFDELIIRLQQIRPEWNWIEDLNPESLSKTRLSQQGQVGIYNSAALFFSQRSKYTQGLEKELTDFKSLDTSEYESSALGNWINRKFKCYDNKERILIEPLPLNEEQKKAVQKSLHEPLTIVTGPPGTGKSQIVTSIIVNAVYHGQTVLFASKNNKAVDVVFDRANGLSSKPVMIRLGSDNAFQVQLANYLSSLLAASSSQSDLQNYEFSCKKHNELVFNLNQLLIAQSRLLEIRNTTDNLEQSIESYRDLFQDCFYSFYGWSSAKFDEIQNKLYLLQQMLTRADKPKQSFAIQLIWPFIKNTRINTFITELFRFKEISSELKIDIPNSLTETGFIASCSLILEKLKCHLKYAREIYSYFKSFESLKNTKSLFELSYEIQKINTEVSDNSQLLWESWLSLLPSRLTKENRKILSDYASILNLIVNANSQNTQLDKSIWGKYYSLQSKVTNILPCWAVTSLSVKGKVPFVAGFFDLIIIDEASQCDIASALPLLYRAKRAVIIGDCKQLTHISKITHEEDIQLLKKYGLENDFLSWIYSSNSLFGLAQSVSASNDIVVLKDHHRSHEDIISFSNNEFYEGALRISTKYEKLKLIPDEPAIRWINISGNVESPRTGGAVNPIEASAVIKELKRIIKMNYKGSIGVVTPFRLQANKISDLINSDHLLAEQLAMRDFLVDTVHRFQGDERDIIIFSTVVSNGVGINSIRFLQRTGNLFNVAITRARASLIVIGDKNMCSKCNVSYLERFASYVTSASLLNNNIQQIDKLGSKYPAISSSVIVSEWEKILYEILYQKGIKTVPQYQVEKYSLDLALIYGDKKLDIEIDGEKYHRNWDGELIYRDQIRNIRLIELGWDVMRFWVYEIRDDVEGCIIRVNKWLADNKVSSENQNNNSSTQ